MAGDDPSSQGCRYTHNDAAFVEYNTRIQSNNLATFTIAVSKFTEWLGSDKAYYPNARAPIISIIESAHVTICRIQGDPSAPFMLDKTLPGLDPWYQPYLSLLKQAGNHLNYFEPELRARLRPLVENAGIKIVQVPTLTENTSAQPNPPPPEGPTKEKYVLVHTLSQAAGPSNQVRRSGITTPVTIPEPQRKGRRKLNKAIFDADTVAALRIKSRTGHLTTEGNNLPASRVIVQQEATVPAPQPVQSSEGAPEIPLVERALNAENSTVEHSQAQSKDNCPSLAVTTAHSSCVGTDDSMLPEVTDDEQPRERPSIFSPGNSEPGNDAKPYDHDGQLEPSEAPAANPSSETAETSNVDKEPPGPPDARLETNPEPMVVEQSTGSPIPTLHPEQVGVEEGMGSPKRPQNVSGVVEDIDSGVPPHTPGNATIRDTTRRRKSGDTVGEEQGEISSEPPMKRIRTESEDITVTAQSTSRAATPEAATCSPSGPTTPAPRSSWVTRGIQRTNSDMILGSDDETSPPSRSGKGAAGKRQNCDSSPSGQKPLAELQTEILGKQMMDTETMPSIQGLSLSSPNVKSNPFAACMIPLQPPASFLSSTVIPDVGHFSHHPPAVRGGTSTMSSRVLPQGVPRQYIFSAAEIRTLVASRGSDEDTGPNKLVFSLNWGVINGISKWRNFKAGQGPLEGSVCLSLAGYPVDSVAALMNAAKESQPFDVLIRQARIKSSWPSGPTFRSTLKDGSGKSYAVPPFSTTDDDFIDISESAIPGTNTITIEDNGQSLSSWLFAVYIHTPTIAYFDAVQARIDKEKKWVDALTSFTTYSLPVVNWDTL